jgi:Zn-dependent protease
MGTGSIQLARVFGIRIGASPSWFVVALIFIVWLSTAYDDEYGSTNGYIMAVVSVTLFFFSLTLHELGHAWVARRNGIEIAGIDLWFFGGIAKLNRDSESPARSSASAPPGPR